MSTARWSVLLAAAASLIGGFAPAAAGATTVSVFQRGTSATAEWVSTDASGCVKTTVDALGSNSVTRTSGTPRTFQTLGMLAITRHDDCADRQLLTAVVVQEPDLFAVRLGLGSAALRMDATAVNIVDGQAHALHVDVAWAATARRS
jgi:hypothetical protein